MTGNEYQDLAARTINWEMGKYYMTFHAMFGLASEVGEIHGVVQKHYQGHPINDRKVKEELGDLLWFAAELCTAYDWKIEDVMKDNIEKLKKRYPDGFSEERSVHRDRYE